MPAIGQAISRIPVMLPLQSLRRMIRMASLLNGLVHSRHYLDAIDRDLRPIARHDPGHESVLMAYDFHLEEQGPSLIEINTNAGGLLPAWLAWARHQGLSAALPALQQASLLQMFAREWRTYSHEQSAARPRLVVIVDDQPATQHLYPEMCWFQHLLRRWAGDCLILDPTELEAGSEGVFFRGRRVDMIYNRHTDFYLDEVPQAGLAAAYLAGKVCLTPNPRMYGLLADKRRLIQLADADFRQRLQLGAKGEELLRQGLPECRLLADWDVETLWRQRRGYVFKPITQFGGKGVVMGKSVSRTRFSQLAPTETLVQRLAPPSLTPWDGGSPMKTDFRLFWYRNRLLALTARLYQGQLTNLRTPGGGFAPVLLSASA